MFDNPLRRLIHDPQAILAGLVAEGQAAADIGCGMGYFTIPLARLVGPGGRVLAVDLQAEMLAGAARRAERAGLSGRISLHRAGAESLDLQAALVSTCLDFILAFWMVHEVPDQERFFGELYAALKPGGGCLLVEPVLHVSGAAFEASLARAAAAGFRALERRRVRFSRAVLLSKSLP